MLKTCAVETSMESRGTASSYVRSKPGMNGRHRHVKRSCPQCGAAALRVHRRVVDRLYSLFHPVHRYHCTSLECGWQGNLPQRGLLAEDGLAPLTTPTGSP
jgi:predicted RNA-binding Zn-ribbon protein involved in translation (DUF1610 family)